ncbi:hypothetical protein JCM11251_002542 [Rhodosporidiobolus azoricus]
MPKKRKHTTTIDLANSSDEASDARPSPSRSKKKRLAPSSAGAIAPSRFSSGGVQLSASQRMAQASSFLAPRSSLFHGMGTPIEHGGKIKPEGSPAGPKRKVKALKPKPLADGVLNFAPSDGATSKKKRLAGLKYAEPELLLTTPNGRPGRKKVKGRKKVVEGKGKKKADSSEEDDLSEDEDEVGGTDEEPDPANRVDWDCIVGPDPDKEILRALVVSPTMQLPWVPSRFATVKETKVHETRINLPEGLSNRTEITIKRVEENLPMGKKVTIGAKFALLTCRDSYGHFYLRFTVYCADNDARQWASTENAIWIKDFPMLMPAAGAVPENSTHTRFSASLWRFLDSSALNLSSAAVGKRLLDDFRLFDFTTSKDIQLVTSLAGVWEGEEEVERGGGLDSLARAMAALEPRQDGKWKIEYLTPVGTLPSAVRFLPRFYAACTGLSPLDYSAQTDSQLSIGSNATSDEYASVKVVLVYPTKSAISRTKEGKGEGQYHLRWEGLYYGAAAKEAKGVLRECSLKSGRVNHSNMILILHQPLAKDRNDDDNEQYEAFLYVGSHAPTPSSWGSFAFASFPPTMTLQSTDLGILYRCATSSTWKGLLAQVNEIVPYERPLEEYGKRDGPQPTVERPQPKEGKQEKVGRPRKKQRKGGADSE